MNTVIQQVVQTIQNELLQEISRNLKNGTLSSEEAKDLARDFRDILPVESSVDLFYKLHLLGKKYIEAKEVYTKYLKLYEQERAIGLLYKLQAQPGKRNTEKVILLGGKGDG